MSGPTEYVLGHSADELARLDEQGAYLRPFTERFLAEAGIGPGTTVLEIGCGTGDLTLLLARLVGGAATVVAIDRSAAALATAARRIEAAGLSNVRFAEADLRTYLHDGPLDAVVGRLVLTHVPERSAALAHLAGQVRAGGVVAFLEPLFVSPPLAETPRPLLTRCLALVSEAMERAGLPVDTGLTLPTLFGAAGLPVTGYRLEGVPVVGPDREWLAIMTGFVRSLLPVVERHGLATAGEVDVETLLDRLVEEAAAAGGTALALMQGSCWARVPG